MIFTDKQIEENWLYAPVMEEINELHDKMGCPEIEVGGPTTEAAGYDVHDGRTWEADAIGDWDGKEEEVAGWAQEQFEEVLNAIDRGKYRYYRNQGDAFEQFADDAHELIQQFNSYDAFYRLCSEWDSHES